MSDNLPPIDQPRVQTKPLSWIERNPQIAIGGAAILAFIAYGRLKRNTTTVQQSPASESDRVFIPATQTYIVPADLPSMPTVNSTVAISVDSPSSEHDYTYTVRVMTTSQERRNYTAEVNVPYPQQIVGAESERGAIQTLGGKVIWQTYALDSSPGTIQVHVKLQSPTPIVTATVVLRDNQSGQTATDTATGSVPAVVSTVPTAATPPPTTSVIPVIAPVPVIAPQTTVASNLKVTTTGIWPVFTWTAPTSSSVVGLRLAYFDSTTHNGYVDVTGTMSPDSTSYQSTVPKGKTYAVRSIVYQAGTYVSQWSNSVSY